MTTESLPTLELDDIQSGLLGSRPMPYVTTALLLRIDDRAAGREALRRLLPIVASSADLTPGRGVSATVGLTHQGLKAVGVPEESLASFSPEFQQGMAARAGVLGDVGMNAPQSWESPLGTPQVHIVISVIAPDQTSQNVVLEPMRRALQALPGVTVIYHQDGGSLPGGREAFGFRDGIGAPNIEGLPAPPNRTLEVPLKIGEFVLGYPDEMGQLPRSPQPPVLGRNGAYLAIRKLHQDVAAFRRFLAEHATDSADQEWLAAKMVGRWRSGAPLVLAPDQDDPALGEDPSRRNAFLYHEDDPRGLKCPPGSHIRRMNPRDALEDEAVNVRRHRILRRGLAYGPALLEGVLEDDGAERGVIFVFVCADLGRQFEFVQSQWVNQGTFIGAPAERDPLIGANDGTGVYTIPKQPIRRRVQGLPQFVSVRGGEYVFVPGLRALRWLAELDT